MPDNSKSPVWFVNNVLKIMFNEQAKAKEYAIDNINKAVSNTVTSQKQAKNLFQPQAACSHCMKKFATNSKPILCPRCSKYKHSGKCLPCPLAVPVPSLSRVSAPQVSVSHTNTLDTNLLSPTVPPSSLFFQQQTTPDTSPMDSAPSQATPPLSLSSPVVAATSVSIAPHQVSASSTTNTPDSNAPSPSSPSQPADDSQVPTAGPILQPAPLAKPRGKAKKQTPKHLILINKMKKQKIQPWLPHLTIMKDKM